MKISHTRNLWCVGRNYPLHAKELGSPIPAQPLFFLKAGSGIIEGSDFSLPNWAGAIHHEIEIALRFDEHLKISHGALALDLTARELQNQAKSKGEPWTLSKSFIGCCPMSKLFPISNLEDLKESHFELLVNGELRQQGKVTDMIFSPKSLVNFATTHFPVTSGDFLLTGTPAGVGPIFPEDQLHARLFSKTTTLMEHRWVVKKNNRE